MGDSRLVLTVGRLATTIAGLMQSARRLGSVQKNAVPRRDGAWKGVATTMGERARTGLGRRWWAWGTIGLLGAAAVALVLINTSRYGAGISPDSTGYLSAARNLLAGRGYTCYDGSAYTAWPPLFPTVLAGLGVLGVEPALGARVLNTLAMGAIVLVSGWLFLSSLRSSALAIVATAAVALFAPMLQIASMVWTEPLFVLLIALFILRAGTFLRRRRAGDLIAMALLAALGSLQRYTGVAIIFAGLVVVLFATRRDAAKGRLRALAFFAIVASTPLALWMVRNYALTSMLTGHARIPSVYSLGQNVVDAADTTTAWFLPDAVALETRGPIVSLLMLLVAAALALRLHEVSGDDAAAGGPVLPAILVIVIYLPFILYTHQVGVRDEIMNDRYLAPIAVPAFWCIFLALDGLRTLLGLLPGRVAVVRHVVPVLCTLWLAYPLTQVADTLHEGLDQGAGGYSRQDWQTLPFVQWLRQLPLTGIVRANAPGAYYALVRPDVCVSPHRSWDLDDFQRSVSAGSNQYLVWFGNVHLEYLYDRDELIAQLYLEEIGTVWNSGVYRMRPSTELAFEGNRIFTDCLIHGAWSRTFTSERYGHRGVIPMWRMHGDGTTESLWQLDAGDGRVLRWTVSGSFTQTDGTFTLRSEGSAWEDAEEVRGTCSLRVDGAVDGDTAAGTYSVTFDHPRWPAADRGTWWVRLVRPVYRVYSRATGRHLFTPSREEVKARVKPGLREWVDEGVAFHVYPEGTQPPGAAAVFGFSSPDRDVRFYTMDTNERDRLRDDDSGAWRYEGTAWYAFPKDGPPPDARPVYRFWSDTAGAHFYTIEEREKDKLANDATHTWAYEGVAWYAIPPEPRRQAAVE